MLICPECKFENPNNHKFCQNCGTSLTHRICPECGTEVALNAQKCGNCGVECGTVRWAIVQDTIFPASEVEAASELAAGEVSQPEKEDNSTFTLLKLTEGSYLDSEKRYQLLEPLPTAEEIRTSRELGLRVLDCQPYQISFLEAMLENSQTGLITPSVGTSGISRVAQAYIDLQPEIQIGIPPIHDTWQQGNLQVVLIEDRSSWRSLLDLWQQETTTVLQLLHWCYQMTQLWAVLEPVNCHPSLLELSNLRLDEDQTLALQKLYIEPVSNKSPGDLPTDVVEQPLTFKALGQVWQALFRQSQRTQFGSLVKMLEDLEVGNIETLARLRSRLEEIATDMATPPQTDVPQAEEDIEDIYATTTAPTLLQLDETEDDSSRNDDMPTIMLSMQLSSLDDAGRTDVGRQRSHNEDYFGIETQKIKLELPKTRTLQARGLYILCDGMGGHAGGEVASELAVTTVRKYFQENWTSSHDLPTEESIRQAVYLANQAIYNLNQEDARSGVGRMGTTLVMLLLQGTKAVVAHVGDSRLYRLTRKRGLEQVTVDHEVGQREIARGVEPSIAYARPDAYQLTQALGPRDESWINPDVEFFEINEDTLLLLTSDGLSDNDLLESDWQTHLEPLLNSGANLDAGVSNLIDLANQHNGHDNITAILVRAKVRPNQDGFR